MRPCLFGRSARELMKTYGRILTRRCASRFRKVAVAVVGTRPGRFLLHAADRLGSPVSCSWRHSGKVALGIGGAVLVVSLAIGVWVAVDVYSNYASVVARRIDGQVFSQPAEIYAAPRVLYPGDIADPLDIVGSLERAGFRSVFEEGGSFGGTGRYQWLAGEPAYLEIHSGSARGYSMVFSGGRFLRAQDTDTGRRLDRVELPAELITTLFDDSRTKRRVLEPDEIPPVLVDAIVAAEDRRFRDHFGIDPVRVAGAAWANLWGTRRQGASTLTMQLAGSVFLDRSQRTWSRKLPEAVIALVLEGALTKDEILALYINEIYLGHRGSFAIRGFGEAAATYFGKDVSELTLSEIAILVGMLPAPNAFAPTDDPRVAARRRDIVLDAMLEEGFIDSERSRAARSEPIVVSEASVRSGLAPYMVDYVRDELSDDFPDQALVAGGLRIQTTIDPELQRAAVDAVRNGILNVEQQLAARGRGPAAGEPPVEAALVVLDPHSGEIKAMVGGRDYATSQYNRITQASRQPGSIFKPFVYAAAIETAFDPLPRAPDAFRAATGFGFPARPARRPSRPTRDSRDSRDSEEDGRAGALRSEPVITALTTVLDRPTEFRYGTDQIYAPDNYGSVFHGMVTVSEALQRSLNVPAVRIAERVGYDRVADLAERAGMNGDIRPFPSIALGAFEVTPLEIAGAWTVFANGGVRVVPRGVRRVESADGTVIGEYDLNSERVVPREVAAVMTHLLENVVDRGTGVGVRSRGFALPAAGKTGTSRDGWFAGYTPDLLAVAWVGFDDNRELGLDGSRSALPIWADFMSAATALNSDEEARDFEVPPGVEMLAIDPQTGALASPGCPESEVQAFVRGTGPIHFCPVHGSPRFSFPGVFGELGRRLSGVFR